MNRCLQFTDKLSAYIDNELSPAESNEMEKHIGSCELCQNEIQALKSTKHILKSHLSKIEPANKSKERILNRVFEDAEEKGRGIDNPLTPSVKGEYPHNPPLLRGTEGVVSFNRRYSRVYRGLALAASILLLIFISISDTTSSPVKVYVLEHQKCMKEGHKDYLCKTEHELSQKIETSMGIKAFIPTYFPEGFKFIKGDVCNIKGVTVAHMVMSDGKRILSYFQGRGELMKNGDIHAGKLENYKYAYWKKDGIYCIVVGDVDDSEIIKIASSQPDE